MGRKMLDLTGKKFGRLTVIKIADTHIKPSGQKVTMWKCLCDCGNEIEAISYSLRKGAAKSCGCYNKEKLSNPVNDLKGKKFGKLTVLKYHGNSSWECLCECGNNCVVKSIYLSSGDTKTCGKCSKSINMDGERYGKLTVIERADSIRYKRGDPTTMWKCKCDCGNAIICSRQSLINGHKKDCGCSKNYNELIGKKFGRLFLINIIKSPRKNTKAECLCDCGKLVTPPISMLKSGKTLSCGCLSLEKMTLSKIKHGKSNTRIYSIWKGMCERCYNQNINSYKNYGGRGVTVCDEWLGENGASNFINWAYKNGYDENSKHGDCTIERINNEKNYSPENCKWADVIEQSYNKRNTIKINIYGELLTIKDISEKYNLSKKLVYGRYIKGITEEKRLLYNGNLRELKYLSLFGMVEKNGYCK